MQTLTTPDGLEIAWYEWAGDGPPVLLAHGFVSSTRGNWVDTGIVDALRATGRRVVGVDARGHGRSSAPHDAARYGEATMARDLRGVADALDVERYDLAGFSMGAVVAAFAAAGDPRVRRLVLGGVGAGLVEQGGTDTRAVPGEALVRAMLTDDPGSLPIGISGFRKMADANGSDRRALAAIASVRDASAVPIGEVTAETLVLAGDDDPLARRPEVLVAALAHARLARVRGDHLGSLKDPRFTAALCEFLTREDR